MQISDLLGQSSTKGNNTQKYEEEKIGSTDMSEKKSKSGSSRSNNKNMIGNIKKIFNRKKHKKNEPTDL